MIKPKATKAAKPPVAVNRKPPVQRARTSNLVTPRDAAVEATLLMPNERDESVAMTADLPNPLIEQAAADVARGLTDTSNGAELDRTYNELK